MWKPGTAAPLSEDASTKTPEKRKSNVSSTQKIPSKSSSSNGPATSTSSSGTKTKLSGATMGMRFMQRKSDAAADAKRIREEQNKVRAEEAKFEWTAEEKQSKETDQMDADDSMDVVVIDEGGSSCDIPKVATASDMYGISAEIIGRRSFGGFRKCVAETWKEAVDMIQYNHDVRKGDKKHISDEELLKRYEKYVKGDSSGKISKQKREKRKREVI
mmetsp:Transcript_6517/g.6122  ORF Transcript_6517/g.6122 Transcript_6517/m.6122 type:complete len:216 (-) Transcript_6517:220-867(-)|eukprot:CAMPEP_0197837776 /NCGR_PEP_ID=MMETSP1437-20131217/33280_1 /TAXON_ID=49252 ORGANISM="Eucampia antarctica, Strain CCMP1452" /NCGR_SAMPLE_ID=MMETSP1437 /ASSEMBLY_ACC=CAM_ASM_001096 /LENGTH=215 /DNA_ID=CAMNT_0043445105 /DNA_START=111 /DNA_END=758 /DNA_ORIENTATION=+